MPASLALGAVAPSFSLPATDGKVVSLEALLEGRKAVCLVFTCNHCPVAIAYEDRLIALARELEPMGIAMVAINPNDDARVADDSLEKMIERARAKAFPYPYLRDASQEVARAYGAACTPDPFVVGADRRLRYAGRIDDSWKDASRVTRRELRDALVAIAEGRSVAPDPPPATGCSIKWR